MQKIVTFTIVITVTPGFLCQHHDFLFYITVQCIYYM